MVIHPPDICLKLPPENSHMVIPPRDICLKLPPKVTYMNASLHNYTNHPQNDKTLTHF